jgi:hypothetical protein
MGFRDKYYTKSEMAVSGRDETSELMEQQHLSKEHQQAIWNEGTHQNPVTDLEESYLSSHAAGLEESFISQYGFTRKPKRWEEDRQFRREKEAIDRNGP